MSGPDASCDTDVPTTRLDASATANRVRFGLVSASSVLGEHLDLIGRHNPELNAFIHVAVDEAVRQAARVDDLVARGEDPGPLAGVPFSVKDVISVAGMPLTAGSASMADCPGTEDAPAVARLKAAGGVCVGKTNTPEFALWTLTQNEHFGVTRSPIPSSVPLSPGGSSGGESAAIAAGMSVVGLGSDFGGSVRWPAHCTGLSSLRPTAGAVPAEGQVPGRRSGGQWVLDPASLQGRLQVIGPMARSVRDVRLMMSVLAGVRPPEVDSLDDIAIGWCEGEGTQPVDAQIVAAVREAAQQLSVSAGVTKGQWSSTALSKAADLFGEIRAADQQTDLRRHLGRTPPGPVIGRLLQETVPVDAARLAGLMRERERLVDQMTSEMPDVLLLPVAAIGAPHLGEEQFDVDGSSMGAWDIVACCRAISLFGFPAGVVPIGRFDDGRPIGVQVVARRGHDGLVLSVMDRLAGRGARNWT